LGIVNLVVFAWLFLRSPQHRWPVAIMLIGQVVARALYLLEATQALQPALPIDVPSIVFEYLMYAIALFGFRIFDPIPLARRTAIEQLHAGMLVLDPQGRVASLNPAAERILGAPASRARGQPVRELLPAYPDGQLADAQETEIELSLPEGHPPERTPGALQDGVGAGQAVRHYTLEISLLKDWRGLAVGRLLLLHDVTEQRRAQAQLVEQQRALAMLHERESLARELHDDLGQVLGFASLKMGATRKLIADGKLAKADDQLAHLESMITQSHADVREYILNLRAAPTGERPFFSALQDYVDGFRQNYGIQVDCSIGAGVDEGLFAQDAQMQVFRIIQEAFSNARKHAGASCVQVSFEMQDDRVRIRIRDDGRGFDPQQAAGAAAAQTPGGHFGLRFMRERAEQLGGSLRVDSAPGQGTCVELTVPVGA
jgi:PAS domain S-box-containing protein